jgi:HSP20 family protein
MKPLDDWNDKRRKKPFNHIGFNEEFEKMFKMMEEMMKQMIHNIDFNNIEPGITFIYGDEIYIDSNRNPNFQEFRNYPRELSDEKQPIQEKTEPLIDIIKRNKDISITVEIPNVEKKDIDLRTTENNLEIKVDKPDQQFHRNVVLPCKVKPKTTKATYKNGVLDVIIKRKNNKHDEKSHNVDIQ